MTEPSGDRDAAGDGMRDAAGGVESVGQDDRKKISTGRIVIWVIVGGIGLYLVLSGVLGIIAKG